MDSLLSRVDHLVYGTPDLDAAVDDLERLLGVRASAGGQHPGRGTRNALMALGPRCYLEIVGPDPDQPPPRQGRWFGIDTLTRPRIVRWAAKGTALTRLAADAWTKGVDLGAVSLGSRTGADGATLRWAFTDPDTVVAGGIVPFFIDWGESDHPSVAAARGVEITGLRAEHPFPDRVRPLLASLGLVVVVQDGPEPALVATVRTARGTVDLQ